MVFRNEKEMTALKKEIEKIGDVEVLIPTEAILFPLRFTNEKSSFEYPFVTTDSNKCKSLSKRDIAILKSISGNASKSIVDIARETKMSAPLCIYHLRSIRDRKIVRGSRIQVVLSKSGVLATCLFMTFKDKPSKDKLMRFARKCPNVNYLIIAEKNNTAILQFFYRKEQEFRKAIYSVQSLIGNECVEWHAAHIVDDDTPINAFPFL
jgi:DNA-binding Lrp family transcriptional regulator